MQILIIEVKRKITQQADSDVRVFRATYNIHVQLFFKEPWKFNDGSIYSV